MRSVHLLVPALLLLLAFPVSRGRYNDDFDDGEDIADFDDNDFAEFEDMNDDQAAEAETAPPPRASPSSQPEEEEEDEDEATVELEDGLDGFEDSEAQVRRLLIFTNKSIPFDHVFHNKSFRLIHDVPKLIQPHVSFRIKTCTVNMTRRSSRGLGTWRRATP